MTVPPPPALGVPRPSDEEHNRALARRITRLAYLIPAAGLVVSLVAMMLAWSGLPEEVAMVTNRTGGRELMPKPVWPVLVLGGSAVTFLVVAMTSTNPGRTSDDTPERRALRAVAGLGVGSLLAAGGTTMTVVMALFGGERDADGNGTIPGWAVLLVPLLALTALAASSVWGARRLRMTSRLRPPVARRSRLARLEPDLALPSAAWTEHVWVAPRLRLFIGLVIALLVVLPLLALAAGAPALVLLLALPAPLVVPATGLRWTLRISPAGITVSPLVGRTLVAVRAEEIEEVFIGRSEGARWPVLPSPLALDPTGTTSVNIRRGPTVHVRRRDGTAVSIATRDPSGAMGAVLQYLPAAAGRGHPDAA